MQGARRSYAPMSVTAYRPRLRESGQASGHSRAGWLEAVIRLREGRVGGACCYYVYGRASQLTTSLPTALSPVTNSDARIAAGRAPVAPPQRFRSPCDPAP